MTFLSVEEAQKYIDDFFIKLRAELIHAIENDIEHNSIALFKRGITKFEEHVEDINSIVDGSDFEELNTIRRIYQAMEVISPVYFTDQKAFGFYQAVALKYLDENFENFLDFYCDDDFED